MQVYQYYDNSYGIPHQPYKKTVNYPDPRTAVNWQGDSRSEAVRVPFGYQPKRKNPGEYKFEMYNYPFQTQHSEPLSHPGKGWQKYYQTGQIN